MKVLAAVAGAAMVVAAIVVASAGGQATGQTITLTELAKGGQFGFVDNPPKSKRTKEGEPRHFSIGDIESFSARVADASGNVVGGLDAHCVVSRAGTGLTHEDSCVGGFHLKDGVIALAVAGRVDTPTTVIAIVGGTGAYNGARGTMTSVSHKNGGATDTLELLP
jgi:hypothetical protein